MNGEATPCPSGITGFLMILVSALGPDYLLVFVVSCFRLST